MDWASHGAVISKLSAPYPGCSGAFGSLQTRQPGRPSRAKKQRRRVQGSVAMRGMGRRARGERKVFLVFRAVKSCSTARFFLALRVPTARHAGFMSCVCMCVGDPGSVIILPSYVGSLHW